MSFLIALTGYSASGKTTLANFLEAEGIVQRFRFDAYFKEKQDCPKQENGDPNWELPESLYLQEAYEALFQIKQGKTIQIPIYSRPFCRRLEGFSLFEPRDIILVEGVHLFHQKEICSLFDYKIWMDIPFEEMYERQRNRGRIYTRDYHEKVMIPAIKQYVDPLQYYADKKLDGRDSVENLAGELKKVFVGLLSII